MDNNGEIVCNKLGKCPVCGKGEMVEGSAGYTCNHFKSMQDKCRFTIFKEYHGHFVTKEEAKSLIENGETEKLNLVSRTGVEFEAKLKIVGGIIKAIYEDRILSHRCPKCGGGIKVLKNGYACENFMKSIEDPEKCEFYVSKNICGRNISTEEVETLAESKNVIIDGFYSKTGKMFSSILCVDPEGKVILSGEICRCPKCGGTIYLGIKAYNCSNYKDSDIKCDFVVWRQIAGRNIMPEEVKELCETRETKTFTFKNKDGETFQRKLLLNEDNKLVMI